MQNRSGANWFRSGQTIKKACNCKKGREERPFLI